MDLNELENKGLNTSKKESKSKEVEPQVKSNEVSLAEESNDTQYTRSSTDWKVILILSVILSLLIGMLIGTVSGFLLGKEIYEREETQQDTNSDNENSIYSQFDYSQFVINAEKNITIESFYKNDEERFYAMSLIGTKIPDLKYLDGENEIAISSLGKDKYIIEFLEPDCAFCNQMIKTVDAYRGTENAIDVIGLSIKDGDLTNFNKTATHTFHLINKDKDTDSIVKLIAWVPTFVYVEDGVIQLVTFGNVKGVEEFKTNVDIAFN